MTNTASQESTTDEGGPVVPPDRDLTGHIGPVRIEWPRTAGYYGGIALAVGFGLIEPPLGVFIAAVPFFKMLNRPGASRPVRLLGQLVEGAAKPVGGDAESTVSLPPETARGGAKPGAGIWAEARQLAAAKSRPAPSRGGA